MRLKKDTYPNFEQRPMSDTPLCCLTDRHGKKRSELETKNK